MRLTDCINPELLTLFVEICITFKLWIPNFLLSYYSLLVEQGIRSFMAAVMLKCVGEIGCFPTIQLTKSKLYVRQTWK